MADTFSWSDQLDQLPDGLSGSDVRIAIAEQADPIAWPDDVRHVDAFLPAAFSKLLVQAWHQELVGAQIAHLYRQRLGGTDTCRIVARAKRASSELHHLARVDFVIVYSFNAWSSLDLLQRLALVDHELSHCGKDLERGWVFVPHDLAEFGGVVRRWGAWQPAIAELRNQLDLFERSVGGRGPTE